MNTSKAEACLVMATLLLGLFLCGKNRPPSRTQEPELVLLVCLSLLEIHLAEMQIPCAFGMKMLRHFLSSQYFRYEKMHIYCISFITTNSSCDTNLHKNLLENLLMTASSSSERAWSFSYCTVFIPPSVKQHAQQTKPEVYDVTHVKYVNKSLKGQSD